MKVLVTGVKGQLGFDAVKELERRAMSTLGRKVRISRSSRKKVVELTYDNDEDLEILLRSLCGETIFEENE